VRPDAACDDRTDAGTQAVVVVVTRALAAEGYAGVGELLREPAGRAAHADGREAMPLAEELLMRPVLSPGAIVCVGLNYRTHILEMGP